MLAGICSLAAPPTQEEAARTGSLTESQEGLGVPRPGTRGRWGSGGEGLKGGRSWFCSYKITICKHVVLIMASLFFQISKCKGYAAGHGTFYLLKLSHVIFHRKV